MSVYLLVFTKKWGFAANSILELDFKQYASTHPFYVEHRNIIQMISTVSRSARAA